MAISRYVYPLLMAALLIPAAVFASDPSRIVIKGARDPSDWVRIESRHLVVYSNTDPDQAIRLADNLEKLDYVLRLYLKPFLLPEDGSPKYTLYFQRGSSWAPGIGDHADKAASLVDSCAAATQAFTFDGDRIWKSKDSDLVNADVNYTLVWNLVAYSGAFLKRHTDIRGPEWFVTGFAAYFGGLQFSDTQMLVGRPAGTSYDLLKDIDNGRAKRLRFEDVLHGGGKNRPVEFYGQWEFLGRSFNLVHYLLSSRENRAGMARYLEMTNNGSDTADAFAGVFGLRGDEVDAAMWRYRQEGLKAYRIDVPDLPKAKIELTRLSRLEGESALDNALLKTCPAPADGKLLLARASAAASKAPAVAFAQMTLSRAQIEWGNPRDAIVHLSQAVENDPSSPEAHYLLGLAHARLAEGAAEGADRQALLAAARARLTQASILAPMSSTRNSAYDTSGMPGARMLACVNLARAAASNA
jgi:tetratricopeptide (TPR) repeat protein